jgi:ubiquinone/menaquinone biosynthesis C-methylase UbiE
LLKWVSNLTLPYASGNSLGLLISGVGMLIFLTLLYHAERVRSSTRCVTYEVETVALNGTSSIAQGRSMVRDLYLWACERLYHELALGYDAISRVVSAGAWPAWRRSVLPHIHGARVLEIGFGTGELLAELAGLAELRSAQVQGLELSPQMHAVAVRRLAAAGRSVPRVQASAAAMPWAARSFDTVVATFPAPYILEPATLAECARVLSGGGRLVIAGLWVRVRNETLRRGLPIFYADPPAPLVGQITRRVEDAGFQVTWIDEVEGWAEVPVLVAELP